MTVTPPGRTGGHAPLGSSRHATSVTPALSSGTSTYQSASSRDTNDVPASSLGTVRAGTPVTVTVTPNDNPASQGDLLTVTVQVVGNPDTYGLPTGTVILGEGVGTNVLEPGSAAFDGNGEPTFPSWSLRVGTDLVYASFVPSDQHLSGASMPLNQVGNA